MEKKLKLANPRRDVFNQNDWAHLHDCWFHVYETKPTREQLEEMFDSLPDSMQILAEEWGCNDTVFREDLIDYLESQKNDWK